MAFDPTVGTEARVAVGAGSVAVAGASEWRLNKQLTPIPINHFELTADAIGVVWSQFERGLASATASLKGLQNVDATDKTEAGTPGLQLGATVILDLLFVKSTPFGYTNLAGFISSFSTGVSVENQPATYDATIQISGVAAAAA